MTERTESSSSIFDNNNTENNVPSRAMIQLLSPDGYYSYLNVPKSDTIDADLIKKQYRKLSLKHHPDKPGGDTETFRVLNRAQKVLSHSKLKQQYDILGLDLDDDIPEDDGIHNNNNNNNNNSSSSDIDNDNNNADDGPTTSQGIVHEIASMVLTNILQMGVRTILMGAISLLLVRYIWTLAIALTFLAYIAYKIHQTNMATAGHPNNHNNNNNDMVLSPFLIGTGLIIMNQSKDGWWFYYWIGESLVIAMFTFNSLGPNIPKTNTVTAGIGIFGMICALWFRGKFWNYVTVIGLELFLAIFVALAFPIMEMVLETIINDKLRKVGDKVRAHHLQLERYYQSQQQQRR